MLLLLTLLASAEPSVVVSSLTTRQLAERCEGKDTDPTANFCTGYIMAAFDTLSLSKQICPSPERASTVEAVGAARKYIRTNQKKWGRAPAFVVRDALRAAFPCSRPKKR